MKVGFWRNRFEPNFPDANQQPQIMPEFKEIHQSLCKKLRKIEQHPSTIIEYFDGCSTCRICGKSNGCDEYTNGGFTWPSGYLHYLQDHQLAIPVEFLNFVGGFKFVKIK